MIVVGTGADKLVGEMARVGGSLESFLSANLVSLLEKLSNSVLHVGSTRFDFLEWFRHTSVQFGGAAEFSKVDGNVPFESFKHPENCKTLVCEIHSQKRCVDWGWRVINHSGMRATAEASAAVMGIR